MWVLLFDSCYQDYICSLIIAPRWGPQLPPPSTCAVLGRSQGCWSGGGGELAVGPWAGRGELPVPQAQGPQLTEVAGATWLSPGPRPVSGLCSHSLSGEFEPRPGGPHCSSFPLSETEGRPPYLARVSRETVSLPGPAQGHPLLCYCAPPLYTPEWQDGWQGARGNMVSQSPMWSFPSGVLQQTGPSDPGTVSDLSVVQFPHL